MLCPEWDIGGRVPTTSDGMTAEARPTLAKEQSCTGLIRYWRSCLADVALGKGRFRQRDLPPDNKQLLGLSTAELSSGRVRQRNIDILFRNVDIEAITGSLR